MTALACVRGWCEPVRNVETIPKEAFGRWSATRKREYFRPANALLREYRWDGGRVPTYRPEKGDFPEGPIPPRGRAVLKGRAFGKLDVRKDCTHHKLWLPTRWPLAGKGKVWALRMKLTDRETARAKALCQLRVVGCVRCGMVMGPL